MKGIIFSSMQEIIIGMIVLVIILFVYSNAFGAESIIESANQNITPAVSIRATNSVVRIDTPVALQNSFFYKISTRSTLAMNSDGREEVMAIISFKGTDVAAKVIDNGLKDSFFVEKGSKTEIWEFIAELYSEKPPLADAGDYYKNGIPAIVKSNTGAPLIVTATTEKNFDLLPDVIAACETGFSMECGSDKKYIMFDECDIEERPQKCEGTMELCGGTATIRIIEEADCSEGQVGAIVDYNNGKDFDAGETVEISFWRAECVREKKTTDYEALLQHCGMPLGYAKMNAGLIRS